MVGIEITVLTQDGQEHKLELESGNSVILLAKLSRKMGQLVKEVENNGNKVIHQEVTFKGSWNMLVLNRFVKGLDKRAIYWNWEL